MVSKIGAIFVFIGSLMAFANAVSQPLPAVSQPVPSFACTMQFDPLCYYHLEKQCFADAGNECSFNGMVARDGLDKYLPIFNGKIDSRRWWRPCPAGLKMCYA